MVLELRRSQRRKSSSMGPTDCKYFSIKFQVDKKWAIDPDKQGWLLSSIDGILL